MIGRKVFYEEYEAYNGMSSNKVSEERKVCTTLIMSAINAWLAENPMFKVINIQWRSNSDNSPFWEEALVFYEITEKTYYRMI